LPDGTAKQVISAKHENTVSSHKTFQKSNKNNLPVFMASPGSSSAHGTIQWQGEF
jgi:hypothetical protein